MTTRSQAGQPVSIYGVGKVAQLSLGILWENQTYFGRTVLRNIGEPRYHSATVPRYHGARVPCDLSRADDGKINDPVGPHQPSPGRLCKLVPKCGHYLQLDPGLEIDLQLLNRDGIPALT